MLILCEFELTPGGEGRERERVCRCSGMGFVEVSIDDSVSDRLQ